MKILLIISILIVGLSAQSYLVQLHIMSVIDRCNNLTNSIHAPLITQIRDRIMEEANEFPKFTQSFAHARALLGSSGAPFFIPIDSVISISYNRLTKDFTDYLLGQDFESIRNTMTEGFVNYRLNSINAFKKVITKEPKKTECYLRERDGITKVFEDFYNHSNNAVVEEFNDLDQVLQIIQNRTIEFRNRTIKDIRDCATRICVFQYVTNLIYLFINFFFKFVSRLVQQFRQYCKIDTRSL